MFFDTEPPPSPTRIVCLETQISKYSAKWLQAIQAGEYWEAKTHARNCLNACALVYGDYSSQLSPALYAYAVTILYKERVERRHSCNTKLPDLLSDSVAGGDSSENRTPGWPGRERAEVLNFEGIEYDYMTDTDVALSNLGSARALMARKSRYFPRLEILEAVGDLFYESGDLKFAKRYYLETIVTLKDLRDPCSPRRAEVTFKYCLALVGSDELEQAGRHWSEGISNGKSSLAKNVDEHVADGKDREQRKVQRSLLSDLEQMEDWPVAVKRGRSSLEEILKKIINRFCELIDIYILGEMGLRVKQATFIPGEDVQVRPAPAGIAKEEDWMRRTRRMRKKRRVVEEEEED